MHKVPRGFLSRILTSYTIKTRWSLSSNNLGLMAMGGGLDATFLELTQEHAQRESTLRKRIEKDKKEALASAAQVSKLLEQSLNAGVQEVFMNEKQIESETRGVATTVQRFIKQTNQWLTLFHNFDSALKEIGDFENWIKIMEYDCEAIANALNRIQSETPRDP